MVKYTLKHTEVEVIRFSGTYEGYQLVVKWLEEYDPKVDVHGFHSEGTMYYSRITRPVGTRSVRKRYDLNPGDILTVVPDVGIVSIHDERSFHLMHEQKVSGWWSFLSDIFLD